MKKVLCILLLLACLSLTVYANPNMQGDVGNINVPKAAPLIDGLISSTEGWSEGVYAYKDIMATFGNCNEILQSFNLYYAYDENGLYYAADIFDNSFILSTGEDDIDNVINDFNIKNENVYGYNGDIFTFMIDPLGRFLEEGYLANTDYNAWYSVGIFEGDICRMYRGHNRSGDVTSDVSVKGRVTEGGWCFEAFIPWDFIIQDTDDMSFGDICVTAEELYSAGVCHRVMAVYLDRFLDPEGEEVATFQRFATCGYILADGLMGYLSSGVCLKAYGITLTMKEGNSGTIPDPVDTTAPVTENNIDSDTTVIFDETDVTNTEKITDTSYSGMDEESFDNGNISSDNDETKISETNAAEDETKAVDATDEKESEQPENKNTKDTKDTKDTSDTQKIQGGVSSTKKQDSSNTVKNTVKSTTKKAATGNTTGGNAAQTFDMGVAAAIGAAVIAVIAFIFVKKKL